MKQFYEKQELVSNLKHLVNVNSIKQKQYHIETNTSEDIGFLTKEVVLLASYLPQMTRLGITIDDIKQQY